jgi:dTDP-4-amino-4,6-dideoxygalactose transaminase
VVDTLRSGWVTTGPKPRRFEEDFAAYLGAPGLHALAVTSATAEVARYLGADVRLVDIDPNTLNIDPALIEAAITPKTRAIIPVHYGGLAADMPAILALARRHGLKVVEDAAHALPTTVGGALVGTLASDATVFSFYANKTITTGEGGMVVTRDATLARRAAVMRLHGMSRDTFDRFTASVPSWYYEIVAPGFKYNLTDIAAAIGLHQLAKAHRFAERRTAIADRFNAAFSSLPVLTPPSAPAGELHAWHLYALRLAEAAAIARDRLIERLFERGIGCSVHYIPLHRQPYWRDRYHLTRQMFPYSEKAYQRQLSLPIYTRMTDADVERVIHAVEQALGSP